MAADITGVPGRRRHMGISYPIISTTSRLLSRKDSPANAGHLGLISGSRISTVEKMTTHSSILSRRIPWTEEPGGLQAMGLQRIRED